VRRVVLLGPDHLGNDHLVRAVAGDLRVVALQDALARKAP
jgi:hypothetical protein